MITFLLGTLKSGTFLSNILFLLYIKISGAFPAIYLASKVGLSVLTEALSLYGKPEIFNTDQGSQYTSYIHTQTLKDNNITISMDGKGRATDNICIERFWRSAKVERIYLNEYNTIKELKNDVSDYIDFYNHKRFHQALAYKKQMSFYYDSLKINNKDYDNLVEIGT